MKTKNNENSTLTLIEHVHTVHVEYMIVVHMYPAFNIHVGIGQVVFTYLCTCRPMKGGT